MTHRKRESRIELDGVFHEPNRLAVVSHLAGSVKGVPFTELRDALALTDGNLSRHLKTLAEAGAVRIDKSFVGARPRTTVGLTVEGRKRFLTYLETLEAVLSNAAAALARTERRHAEKPGRAAPEPA